MRFQHFLLFILLLTGVTISNASAQQAPQLPLTSELSWPGTEKYDPAIPTPEQVIGHRIGERHTIPSQVVQYFEAVAKTSDRVTLREHGRTHEGRALIHAIVTSPERQSKLDDIQKQHATLFSDAAGFGESALKNEPAVAYMGYSIHGNEASGTEAAILTLYHLAAGQGDGVDSILNRVVTIIDPMFNPDGRDRFCDWANRNRGGVANTDPQDREHREAWPNGRTNHYWFDLNRDWMPLQHPESQARIEMFYKWRPQVLTDFHEMGSNATYFFQPGIPSRNNPLTPARNQELTGLLTDNSAKSLDRIGSMYYTRESFDDFYIGKGSTYPDVNGSVGILFEQASSRALDREVTGGTLSYGFSIRNQLTASLATLQSTAALKDELNDHTKTFYSGSSAYAKTLSTEAYLLPIEGQHSRASELAALLKKHRVEVYPVTGSVSANGKRYGAGEAYVIPTNQTQARFIQAVLEPNTTFQDSLFYDVSTWCLPMAFDVEMHSMKVLPKGEYEDGSNAYETFLKDFSPTTGKMVGDAANAYALVFAYEGYYAPRSVYRITSAGGHARLLNEPSSIVVDGKRVMLPRGSVVLPLTQNPIGRDKVMALAKKMMEEDGLTMYAVNTGLTPTGPDLGGRSTELLKQPKIALLTGNGTSPYQAGEAWHLLSERLHIPVSLLDADQVGRADLSRYTHIAMTGGRYNDLDVASLQKWVRNGGTLLASHTAAGWAVDKKFAKLDEAKLDIDSLLQGLLYAQLDEARGAQYIGGAILNVELDATHPLAYGISDKLPMFRQHTRFFKPSETPGATVGRYASDPLASGYLSRERKKQGAGQASIVESSMGRGRVILFFDNPNFRAFWRGSERVWLNGIMLR
ncbi:MAG: M14 family metallopeptidase [Saprospiraceae bacterium]